MRRLASLLVGLSLLAACGRDTLPPEMTIERVVEQLAPPLAPNVTVTEPNRGAVHRAVVQPGDRGGPGAPRDAVVAPPPSRLGFRLAVPPEAVLRFSIGVEGDKQRDRAKSGLRFRISVDGQEAFAAGVNPAYRRRDRRWVDADLDLRRWAGRTVDLVLETRAEDAGRTLAGTPAWSALRVVREERRARQPAAGGPNVLVLLVDTLRADRLGVYGADPSPTPALDAFAARGLVFDVTVAQSSWTMPSVAALLTGLHPRSHGAVGPDVQAADGQGTGTFLPDALVTLAEVAQGAGVTTMGVSTNVLIGRATNLAQGFETFVELPFDDHARDYAPATAVNREFLAWLARARGLRFLAYLHYMEVHGPYGAARSRPPDAPPSMRADLAAGDIHDFARKMNRRQVPPPTPVEVAHLRALYDQDVRRWDHAFGELVAALDAAGVLRNTVVVVVADHGEEFLEHGKLTHGSHLYDETIRVPLIIVGPGIAPGRRRDQAQHIDLLPTVAALLGAEPPPGLPGRDLLTTRDGSDAISEIVSGFGDDGAGAGTVALRTERWKLIRSLRGTAELYDLTADPGEHRDLGASPPEAAALGATLDAWAQAAPRAPRGGGNDPGLRDRLRQLGYVE
jgi:arylsulfatase A-like enzyme